MQKLLSLILGVKGLLVENNLKDEIVKVKTLTDRFAFLLGLTAVLFLPISVAAQNANTRALGSEIGTLAKADTSSSNSSLFVVSDEELKTYSNTADLIRELKVLKKDKQSLLDYSKKLREKFKDLEEYYAKQNVATGEGSIANNFAPDILAEKQAELESVKKEKEKISQEIQNLKTEYDAVKLQNSALKEEFAKYKEVSELKIDNLENSKDSTSSETVALKQRVEELSTDLSSKEKELASKENDAKACFEQLDQSQKLVTQIPEFEREIVELKNELLMKKSAAELFGLDSSDDSKRRKPESAVTRSADRTRSNRSAQIAKVKEEIVAPAVVKPIERQPSSSLNSDMMIIEVTGDKVALRAGAGLNNSTIMDIGKGAKLTVEAREKDWYRVNSPTGGRAYIHKDYVKIIDNGKRQNVKADNVSKSNFAGMKEDFVPMEAEPIKPPLPAKPIKRIGAEKDDSSKSTDSLSMTQESIALQALKNAMSNNSKELGNTAE